jgi:hypothetical protein
METKKTVDTGTYVFLIKYRKLLVILCVFVLVFALPVQIYNAPIFDQRHKYEDIGFLFDTVLMGLGVPVWMLIKIRKAYKTYNNEEEWKKL